MMRKQSKAFQPSSDAAVSNGNARNPWASGDRTTWGMRSHAVVRCSHRASLVSQARKQYAARKALNRSLRRLCQALAKAPRPLRLAAIEQASKALRHELILMRQAELCGGTNATLQAKPCTPPTFNAPAFADQLQGIAEPFLTGSAIQDLAVGSHTEGRRAAPEQSSPSMKRKAGMPELAAATGPREVQANRARGNRGTSVGKQPNKFGNVWTVRTAHGEYYKVRLAIGRVVVTSCRLDSLGAAHSVLERLRLGATMAGTPGADDTEAQLHALAAATSADSLQLSFQAVLDVRRWLGCRIHSKAVASVDEVLELKRQVQEAESHGGTALSDLWKLWMEASRHMRGRARRWRTAEVAAALDRAKSRYSVAVQRKEARAAHLEAQQSAQACRAAAREARRAARQKMLEARRHASSWRRLCLLTQRTEAALVAFSASKPLPELVSARRAHHTWQGA